ncbi:uncharacterized protein [Oscarella lobularis]|uniref:uncharacterized protein n=1 Tax=Oscarella lobularis TaxID=121494 RepID=UPI003313536A
MTSATVMPISDRNTLKFSYWSRHEPVAVRKTDHWAKQKSKSYAVTKLPTGHTIAFCRPCQNKKKTLSEGGNTSGAGPLELIQFRGGTVAPIGDPIFNSLIDQRLHNPSLVARPDERRRTRSVPPSAYYERAKLGYTYWYKEPGQMSYRNKVSLGAKDTVLGLAFSPRK